jgi:hypothetical protein
MENLYVIRGKSYQEEYVYYDHSRDIFDLRSFVGTRYIKKEDAEEQLFRFGHYRNFEPKVVLL